MGSGRRCVVLDVTRTVTIPVEKIADWPSFHDTLQRELGFPDFYRRNMNAWIDCMTSVDIPSDGITTVTVQPGEILVFRIDEPFESCRRCPAQYDALVESAAFVNFRRLETGEFQVLALLLLGRS